MATINASLTPMIDDLPPQVAILARHARQAATEHNETLTTIRQRLGERYAAEYWRTRGAAQANTWLGYRNKLLVNAPEGYPIDDLLAEIGDCLMPTAGEHDFFAEPINLRR